MIPRVLSRKVNLVTQTDVSVFDKNTTFDTSNDESNLRAIENPEILTEPEMVNGIIRPLTIAPNGTVINHHIPRLYKRETCPIIRTLEDQIEANPNFRDSLIRQMAAKLIPGLSDSSYQSLYTNPIKMPYSSVKGYITLVGTEEPVECTAIFSLDGTLSVVTDNETVKCSIDLWDTITNDREIDIIDGDKPFGKLRVTETVNGINYNNGVPGAIINSLKIDSEEELDQIITPDDTSFVDVVLSIPTLTKEEANDLLTVLHSRKLLSPYLRSKVCEIQLRDPIEKREWPELLGRFIFLLDSEWTLKYISYLKNNDVMSIFKHVKDMKDSAIFVLQTALKALEEIRGADSLIFFWTLLFLSIMDNATINNPHGDAIHAKLVQMWRELQKKEETSNTRSLTKDVIERIKGIKYFSLDCSVHQESEFVELIFKNHHDEIFKILPLIPFKKEESNPLYFPTVLALETALEQLKRSAALIESQSESLASEALSESYSRASSRSRHSRNFDESDQYMSSSSRGSRASRHSVNSRGSRNSQASRHSNAVPELNQHSTMDSNGDINSDYSSASSRRRRSKSRSDSLAMQYSESESSRSSRKAPPPIIDDQINRQSDDSYDYEEEVDQPQPINKESSHPREDDYSAYDDSQALSTHSSRRSQSSHKSQSVRDQKQYSVSENYYYSDVSHSSHRSNRQQQQAPQPQEDDYEEDYYYSDDEPANTKSQKSLPLAQASSLSERSGASQSERSASSRNQIPSGRISQKPSEVESSQDYSSQRSTSSKAKIAAIRAAQRSASSRNSTQQEPSRSYQSGDDDYSYYSDGNQIKNTASNEYKAAGLKNSYTPSTNTSKRSATKSKNTPEPIEDVEEPYDYSYEYDD